MKFSEIFAKQREAAESSGMVFGIAGYSVFGFGIVGGATEEFKQNFSPSMIDIVSSVEWDNQLSAARHTIVLFTFLVLRRLLWADEGSV